MNFISKTMNFTIEQNDYTIDFVFFPKYSHCYSFNNQLSKNRSDVNKANYSWQIIEIFKDEFNVIFSMEIDEDSILTKLSKYIRDIINKETESIDIEPSGRPGSEWHIHVDNNNIRFEIWKNTSNQGYRFWLTKDRAVEFAQFLDKVNTYMVKYGEVIYD